MNTGKTRSTSKAVARLVIAVTVAAVTVVTVQAASAAASGTKMNTKVISASVPSSNKIGIISNN